MRNTDVSGIEDKGGDLVRGKINCSPGYYDPDETVLINPKNFGLGKRQGEKSRQYLVFIALPDERNAAGNNVLWQIPMEWEAWGKPILGAEINFDFSETESLTRSGENQALAREFKKVKRLFGKSVIGKKWQLSGLWLPNTLFIQPIAEK
jgi:hypothetical protein